MCLSLDEFYENLNVDYFFCFIFLKVVSLSSATGEGFE